MAAYSMDLRKRVLRAWDGGMDAEGMAAQVRSESRVGASAGAATARDRRRSRRGNKRSFAAASWRDRRTGSSR